MWTLEPSKTLRQLHTPLVFIPLRGWTGTARLTKIMLSSHEHVALPVAHKRQCGAAKKQVSASSKKDESVVGEGPFQLVALVGKEKGRWHSELTSFSETLEESVRHHRPLAMF